MNETSAQLQRAVINSGYLNFENLGGLRQAIVDGLFLLKIPDAVEIQHGIRLCREFYRDGPRDSDKLNFRGFRGKQGIYFDREHFQTEHLLIDKPGWAANLPAELVRMIEAMDELCQIIMRATLTELSVNRGCWRTLSGGAIEGQGTHWFAASHYRPERNQPGCAEHKDTGFVTALYIEQTGLEAWINDRWYSIEPIPGHFIINFGASFEILSAPLELPVKAVPHRVRQCAPSQQFEDRFSFATFINPQSDVDLYEVYPDGRIQRVMKVEEFLRKFNEMTWNDRHKQFGLATSSKYLMNRQEGFQDDPV